MKDQASSSDNFFFIDVFIRWVEIKCLLIDLLQVWGFSSNYWELRRQHPRLKKLKKLLMEKPYAGLLAEVEEGSDGNILRVGGRHLRDVCVCFIV